MQVPLFVLDATPEPLDKDVVHPPTFAVDAGKNSLRFEDTGKGSRGKLRP